MTPDDFCMTEDYLMRVCEIETEIQAILQVKLRRKLLWHQETLFDVELMDAEIDEIRIKFPVACFSRNYNPKEAHVKGFRIGAE